MAENRALRSLTLLVHGHFTNSFISHLAKLRKLKPNFSDHEQLEEKKTGWVELGFRKGHTQYLDLFWSHDLLSFCRFFPQELHKKGSILYVFTITLFEKENDRYILI